MRGYRAQPLISANLALAGMVACMLLGAAGLAGCENNDEVTPLETRLTVLNTTPQDLPTPYTGTQPLVANFGRATNLGEMSMSIFPSTSTGLLTPNRAETMSTWTWHDVVFDPAAGSYFWVIDGLKLGFYFNLSDTDRRFIRVPILIRVPSSPDRLPLTGFAGSVESLNSNVLAVGTVVFALPSATTTFNPLDPGTFDPAEVTGIAIGQRTDTIYENPAQFTMTMLPVNTAFIVVAIQDTNADLVYSPIDDWWGMYEDEAGLASVVSRENTGEKDSGYISSVNFVLRPPVGTGE